MRGEVFEISSHSLAEGSLFGRGIPWEFGHDALEVDEVCRKSPGSLFEHCKLSFGSFLVVRVIVDAV